MSNRAVHVIAAAAIGFVAGILLAPKSGEETRKEIKGKAREAKDYAGEKVEQVKAAAKDARVSLREGADHVSDEATHFAKSAKSSASRVAADVSEEATKLSSEAKTRAARVAEEAKRTAGRVQKDAEKHLR